MMESPDFSKMIICAAEQLKVPAEGPGKNETTTGKCELRLAWNRHFKQNSESAD